MRSFAERLRAARRRNMVGRMVERALFTEAVAAPEPPFFLLYLHGPGGIGKTTLLESFREHCEERSIPFVHLDGRYLEATPNAFQNAVQMALPGDATQRSVLFVDTYERLESLDDWLRDIFLPGLPDDTLVVIAGRNPLGEAWRTDSGWQALLRTVALTNLSAEESRTLLTARQVPAEQHTAVLHLTHGYPLALSLVVDVLAQQGQLPSTEQQTPDMVQALMQRLLEEVPSQAHRQALEASALLRVTTEAGLAALLQDESSLNTLFDWLAHLSFMDTGPIGFFPHDMARDAILADLRWRNPERYIELHRRARQYFTGRLKDSTPGEQQRVLWDYIFLHRDNPIIRGAFTWQESVDAFPDAVRPSDFPALEQMVRQHEGAESAALFALWWQHPAHTVQVFRERGSGEPLGFLSLIAWDVLTAEERVVDPAFSGATRVLANRPPLKAEERVTYFRFWMARDTYHSVSAVQSLIIIHLVRHYLSTPHLAFTFFPVVSPDVWQAAFRYAEMERLPEADFEVGGRTYGVYGHDWRQMPPLAWLAALAEKEAAPSASRVAPGSPVASAYTPLEATAFAGAVRDALKQYNEPDALQENILLEQRFIVERAGRNSSRRQRVNVLRSLLREMSEGLQASPRKARAYRALLHTYLQPAPTQEKAAERLDLPFSTYRRHLQEGIGYVVEALYRLETADDQG